MVKIKNHLFSSLLFGILGSTPAIAHSKSDGSGLLKSCNAGLFRNELFSGAAVFTDNTTENRTLNEITALAVAKVTASIRAVPVSNTWSGTTWSSGTPTSSTDVIIASSVAPGAFSCANLTINSGVELAIGTSTVVVTGNITNNGNGITGTGTLQFNKSGSTLLLSGNNIRFNGVIDVVSGTTLNTNGRLTLAASSKTSYGQITGSAGIIIGSVTVEKVLDNTDLGWRQLALPVDALITSLSGIDMLNGNSADAKDRNIFYWDAGSSGTAAPGGGTTAIAWAAATNTDDETKAYTIYSDNSKNNVYDVASKLSISGTPNQSNYTISLGYNFDPNGNQTASNSRGWNFIPNRFASNIDVYTLVNDVNFGSTYKAVHVFNQATGQYVGINQSTLNTYNSTGGSKTIGTAPGTVGAYDILPFQGFWVKATSTSQSIIIKNTHRSTDLSTLGIYSRINDKLLRLNVADASGRGDQITVFFDANATEGLDGTMDLLKLKSPDKTVPTLYCSEGELELCADALPLLNSTRNIPLAFESYKPGTIYTFSPDLSAFNLQATVSIEDTKTGKVHDFFNGDYQFTYDEGFGKNRFVLHIAPHSIAQADTGNKIAFNQIKDLPHSK